MTTVEGCDWWPYPVRYAIFNVTPILDHHSLRNTEQCANLIESLKKHALELADC